METYEFLLADTCKLMLDKLSLAKNQQGIEDNMEDASFNKGVSYGIYECLVLLRDQALVFGVDLHKIGLGDIVLESYL